MNALGASARQHAADVFDKHAPRAGLHDNSASFGPEISLVVFPKFFTGEAVWLARDSANDEIHDSTPWAAAEGSDI